MFQLYHKYLKNASKYGSMRNDLLNNCMDSYSIIDNNGRICAFIRKMYTYNLDNF